MQPPPPQPDYRGLEQFFGEDYQTLRLDLADGIVPEQIDVLIVGKPGPLGEKQQFGIDQYLMRGGKLIVLAGRFTIGMDRAGLVASRHESPFFEMLKTWGVTVLPSLVMGGLYGCAEHSNPDPPLKPFVEITSGPIEGGTVSYAIRIAWEGSDRDGFVEHFEYAVDPPSEFSEAEIEGKITTVTVETIEGQNGEPDVTRISKVVGGEVVYSAGEF